jgi:hypothetical protein
MFDTYARKNKISVSICLFLFIFGMLQWLKPAFLYTKKGTLREFGVGYKNKTILPMGILSIVLGILCYIFTLYIAEYL